MVASLSEINKATEWDLPTDGPKTLNGLVFEQLESIPDGNVSFALQGYRFETEEMAETMVKKVVVSRIKPALKTED